MAIETTGGSAARLAPAADTGRIARRRIQTRTRLLEAAHAIMSEAGVDAAKLKDITDRADVGFGTFYNYFESKDDLAEQVLDCVINDLGRRNVEATRDLRESSPALIMPTSMRLVMREAANTQMWRWWVLRPDMLIDRMRDGFGPFGRSDMAEAIRRGIYKIGAEDIDSAWGLANWMMVGGIHDIVVGAKPSDNDSFVVAAIMRSMGVDFAEAQRLASHPLPPYPAPNIDWTFSLADLASARPNA